MARMLWNSNSVATENADSPFSFLESNSSNLNMILKTILVFPPFVAKMSALLPFLSLVAKSRSSEIKKRNACSRLEELVDLRKPTFAKWPGERECSPA